MTNRKIISNKLKELGFKLGCYDKNINKLSPLAMEYVLPNLIEESTDVYIAHNGEEYALEINTVDNKKDLQILSRTEYEGRYGEYSFVDKFDLED